MNEEWPKRTVESIEDYMKWLCGQQAGLIYRGQAVINWPLVPSLDRNVPREAHRLDEEQRLLKEFNDRASRFLGTIEKKLLEEHHAGSWVARMTVMQHFGGPTRLLDWTKSPAVASYFACIDQERESADGVVCWIRVAEIEEWVDNRWKDWGFHRLPIAAGEQIILDRDNVNACSEEFVCPIYLPVPFPRAQAQQGLFTFGSRLGVSHDSVLKRQVSEDGLGQLIIPGPLKKQVINQLERLGVDAVSLQHAGADRVGMELARKRRCP